MAIWLEKPERRRPTGAIGQTASIAEAPDPMEIVPAASQGQRTRARSGLAAAFILAALLGVFFFDVVFLGKTLKVSRTIATVYPTGPAEAPGAPPQTIPITDNTPGVLEEPYLAFSLSARSGRS